MCEIRNLVVLHSQEAYPQHTQPVQCKSVTVCETTVLTLSEHLYFNVILYTNVWPSVIQTIQLSEHTQGPVSSDE